MAVATAVDVLNMHRAGGAEHQRVQQEAQEGLLPVDALCAPEQGLDHDDQYRQQRADAQHGQEVAAAGDHGDGVQHHRQKSTIADRVNQEFHTGYLLRQKKDNCRLR